MNKPTRTVRASVPAPIRLGGMAEPVLQRVGALADGWYPRFPTLDGIGTLNRPAVEKEPPAAVVQRVREGRRARPRGARHPGFITRRPSSGPAPWRPTGPWAPRTWRSNTMKAGLKSPAEHIAALRRFKESV